MTLDASPAVFLRHFPIVVVFNSAVTGVLMLVGESRWDVQFVYAQSIGLSIWACIDVGRFTFFPNPETRWPRGYWGLVLIVGSIVIGYVVGTIVGDQYCGCNTWSMTGMDHHGLVTSLVTTIVAGGVGTAYFYVRGRAHHMMAKSAVTAQALADAKLKLLESQLEPHMLFNTLANLRVLIAHDPQRAQAMLDRLIAFLRATLAGSRESAHSLADEFARLDDYLALMKVRMGERLQTRLELPAHLAGLQVPPLLLQPLVENAIKHGLEPNIDGGLVEVTALDDGDMLVLRVCDTGAGLASPRSSGGRAPGVGVGADAAETLDTRAEAGSHFGLVQVRERLANLYGAAASLTLEPGASAMGGAIATIRAPLAACRPAPRPVDKEAGDHRGDRPRLRARNAGESSIGTAP